MQRARRSSLLHCTRLGAYFDVINADRYYFKQDLQSMKTYAIDFRPKLDLKPLFLKLIANKEQKKNHTLQNLAALKVKLMESSFDFYRRA